MHLLDTATDAAASRFAAAQASRVPGIDMGLIIKVLSAADAQMLSRMIQFGETQEEAGAALGLGPAASRKRYQRAIAALKQNPNISLEAMSRFPAAVGF